MKLAFCLFKYFPYGGLQRDFMRIAKTCQQRGHSVDVYTTAWRGDIPEGFTIIQAPLSGCTNHRRMLNFSTFVEKQKKQKNYDAVIGFNRIPHLDVYFAADPCYQAFINTEKNFLYRLMPRCRHYLNLEKSVFASSEKTKILVYTAAEQEKFMRYYATPNERFHLLPAGIERDRAAPSNANDIRAHLRYELEIHDDEYLLLMVGSHFKTKGVDRSLQAIAALPSLLLEKTHLMIVGEGDTKPFIRLATQLNISDRVTFLGARDDVPRFLLGADLLLHPAYTETAGMILLEAIAAGLPLLATANCGYAFHIENARAGLLSSYPFQQQEFNKKLEFMLTSKEYPHWQQNALAYAAKTDLYSMPEKAVAIIEQG